MIMIKMPWPPSLNRCYRMYRGRYLLSAEGRAYQANLVKFDGVAFGEKRVSVKIKAYPPDKRRRDLDNLLKPLLDLMQKGGVFNDDGQIDALSIVRGEVKKEGYVVIGIEEL